MRENHKSKATNKVSCTPPQLLDDRRLHEIIASRAYDLYEKRGCLDGFDCEDWLEAERQILAEVESRPMPLPRAITEHAA